MLLNRKILILSIATQNKYMPIKERKAISNEIIELKLAFMLTHIFEIWEPKITLQ